MNYYAVPELNLENSNCTRRNIAVKNINGGKQCIMEGCFVKQYDYSICWAASLATILRYSNSAYVNEGLNAFQVAMNYAYEYDLSTNPNDDPNAFQGASVYDAQYMLAIYGVYYSVLTRKLSYNEIKDEIDHGYPIYMASAYYNEDNVRSGHATVLYGYYSVLGKKFFKIWNPGSGAEELAGYNSKGDICYAYNENYYLWESSICKGGYAFK